VILYFPPSQKKWLASAAWWVVIFNRGLVKENWKFLFRHPWVRLDLFVTLFVTLIL
jgi:hypothetical protein